MKTSERTAITSRRRDRQSQSETSSLRNLPQTTTEISRVRDIVQDRTEGEALRDVDYAIRVAVVHERFFTRLKKLCKVIELIGGSAALIGVFAGSAGLMAAAGITVAIVAYTSLIFDFGEGARRHADAIRRLSSLSASAKERGWELKKIDAGLAKATEEGGFVVEALRVPCFNEVQRRHGLYSNQIPVNRWQRFMAAIA